MSAVTPEDLESIANRVHDNNLSAIGAAWSWTLGGAPMPEPPVGSVVMTGHAVMKHKADGWTMAKGGIDWHWADITALAAEWGSAITVLHRPDEDAVRVPRALLERLVHNVGEGCGACVDPALWDEGRALLDGAT